LVELEDDLRGKQNIKPLTNAMNEWGFGGKDSFVRIGRFATSARPEVYKFKLRLSSVGLAMC